MDAETQESLAAGQAGWEVRVELRSHRQAVELAARLQAEGRPVIRRWKYLVLGANNEDDATALAEAIRQESPAKASVHAEAVPFVQFAASHPGA
jgi:N-acetylglutamate synthase/N-acetylornithine aminotransferase